MMTRTYAWQRGRGESSTYFGRAYALHPLYSGAALAEWTTGRAPSERPEGISMGFMTESERAFARVLSHLVLANPFLPDWVTTQREALGRDFVSAPPVWHALPDQPARNQNITALTERVEAFARTLRERLAAGTDPGPDDRALYQDLAVYLLFAEVEPELKRLIAAGHDTTAWAGFARFARTVGHRLDFPALGATPAAGPPLRPLLPDPPRLPLHLTRHPRRLRARRAAARRGLAVDLHARHAALPPRRSTSAWATSPR